MSMLKVKREIFLTVYAHYGGCLDGLEIVEFSLAGDLLVALSSVWWFVEPGIGVIASLVQKSRVPYQFGLLFPVNESAGDVLCPLTFAKKYVRFRFLLASIDKDLKNERKKHLQNITSII